ncbi:hypothetical protein [Nocardia yunnanensis]|uniref:hypothetical protein n=1 Tax=Nocardia yunnanensis TaxID=2382165 RepID=UPI001CA3FDF6|nr:hypothetical protein [Nocardia yunnanensis]
MPEQGRDATPPPQLGAAVSRLVADVPEPMLVRPDAHLAWSASGSPMPLSAYPDLLSSTRPPD